MNTARMLYRFDDDEKLYTASEIMRKLGKYTSHIYDAKEQIIDGHKIKLVKKAVYDIYVDRKLIFEGVTNVSEKLDELGYSSHYYHAKNNKKGLYIKQRWLIYDGKERSEKVQSSLL